MSVDIIFLEHIPFSSSSGPTNQGEVDDLLVYTITPPSAAPLSTPIKPLFTQTYSYRTQLSITITPVPCPDAPNSSSSDPVLNDNLPIALHKGKCTYTYPVSFFVSYSHLSSYSYSFIASLDSISIPKIIHQDLAHSGWCNAMIEEMNALDVNGTWTLENLLAGKQAIGCK